MTGYTYQTFMNSWGGIIRWYVSFEQVLMTSSSKADSCWLLTKWFSQFPDRLTRTDKASVILVPMSLFPHFPAIALLFANCILPTANCQSRRHPHCHHERCKLFFFLFVSCMS